MLKIGRSKIENSCITTKILICISFCLIINFNLRAQEDKDFAQQADRILIEHSKVTELKDPVLQNIYDLSSELSRSDHGKALQLAELGYEKSKITSNRKAEFSLLKASIFQKAAKYEEAQQSIDFAIQHFQNNKENKWLAEALLTKSKIHIFQGNINEASILSYESIELFKAIDDTKGMASNYLVLSDVSWSQQRYEESQEWAEKAIVILKGTEDAVWEKYEAYIALGYAKLGTSDLEGAFEYTNRAVIISNENNGSPNQKIRALMARGNSNKYLEKNQAALDDYNECLQLSIATNNQHGISTSYANISDIYLHIEDYPNALIYRKNALDLMLKTKDRINIMENYDDMGTIYEKMGDFENALKFQQKAWEVRDSTLSAEHNRMNLELESKFGAAEKDNTIQKQNEVLWLIGTLGIFALVATFFSFWSYKRQKKAKEEMAVLNSQLKTKNLENEILLKEIHHRVKNNLQTISSLLRLQSNEMESEEVHHAMEESRNRVASMALIHERLYQGENLASIEMKDYFKTLGDSIIDSFGYDQDQIQLHLNMKQMNLDVDHAIPLGLIANELITNSMKYAFNHKKRGNIKVEMYHEDDMYYMNVSDTGTGESKANDVEQEFHSGFGLKLVNLLVRQLEGEITRNLKNGYMTQIKFQRQVA